MSKKTIGVLLAGAVLMLLVTQSAVADNVYATIRGNVTDSTGAVLPGVQLTATNTETGVKHATVSQANGLYEFLQLPIGGYMVSATKTGFKTYKSTGITLTVNQVYELPIGFQVGLVTEIVEVKADPVQVETTSNQLQTLVTAKQIVDLPLINRNFTALEQLAPGVMSSNDRFGTFSVNGSQTQQSSYLINGTDTNDIPLNTPLILPSPDAIQEFNLISSTINPEYGRNSGGIVNAVIKNGTNQFHGDVFDFYRDTFLNTHNFFSPTVPVFHQNQFGATLGGPVWKDKTFFFLSYQGIRARTASPVLTSVLTGAQRGGDFSSLLTKISNNATPFSVVGDDGIVHPAGTPWKQVFHPGTANFGKLPVSDFNSISNNLLNQFVPQPNFNSNQFSFNPITNSIADQGIARVDHTLTSSDQVWGALTINHAPSNTALPFTGANLPGFAEVDSREAKQFTLAENHTFNSSTLNEVRLGYQRFNFDAVEPATPAQPSSFGFTGINSQNTKSAGAPLVSVTGLFTLGFSTNGPQPRKDQNYQFTDNFSKIVGKHTMKFGTNIERVQVDNPFFGRNNGAFSFSTNAAFSTGNAGVDFLLGIPNTYAQGAGGVINARAYEYYLYAQDSWKVKSNLTLNYGAGYQIDTPYNNNQFGGVDFNCFIPGQQSGIFPTAPAGLDFPGDHGCNNSGTTTRYGHIAPRLGFAYSPDLGWLSGGSSNKFSIRGGFGIYFNRTEEEGALQNLGAPPFGVNSSGIADVGGNPSFANPFTDISTGQTLANKFPFTNFPKPGDTTVSFAKLEPFTINTISPNLTTPYSENFNLNIEREFAGNTVVTVGYVGALGRHLYRSYDGNPITAAGQAACLTETKVVNGKTIACKNVPNTQNLLFPQNEQFGNGNIFAGIGLQATDGTSAYNSLQFNVNKGITHGFSLLASYTWSHAIDTGSGLENSGFGARGINLIDPALNVGDSAFDARQRIVFGYNYTIPNLHSLAHWAPDKVFGGWKMTGITTLQTGFPVNFSDSNLTSLSCDGFRFYACADSPNQIAPTVGTLNTRNSSFANSLLGTPTQKDYFFNPNGFTRAALGTFGNTRRDALHGPGLNNTDFALLKDTKLTERTSFQMGIEGYNLFNHTQFGQPTTNIESPNFGRITSAAGGRLVQLRAKFNF